ncbi:uncharacterized protein LOC124919339 [Impatiens glandulifera]|uniref:uncharacterized protein LOC124919339 n=1 Tax=Impatiens glandulifera TaxID=253017 RepID=UPI001FB100CB|nr:uncharacterized protein LOC124919339 [Impatiens glandulifera]
MATEVLRPQDCLSDRIRGSPVSAYYHRRKATPINGNNTYSKAAARKSTVRPEKKIDNTRSEATVSRNRNNNNNMLIGHVTILKRGESVVDSSKIKTRSEKTNTPAEEDLVVCGTERLGPDPDLIPKQMRIGDLKPVPISRKSVDMYAGSAFSMMSPSPSSLPLPSFFSKKQVLKMADDSTATRDLRRLLRLE